jgi:hypothetical protein
MVESLERLYRLDPERDRAAFITELRALWQMTDPASLPEAVADLLDEDLTRLKQERDLAQTTIELLTTARVSLQREVERLKQVNERQAEMLREAAVIAMANEEWETLHHEVRSPEDWSSANRELASKRREGWEIVQIETEVFPTGNGRPYMALRFVTLKRSTRPAPAPEPEQGETRKMVETVTPLPSYSVGSGAHIVMPEPQTSPALNRLKAALDQPLVKAIRDKGMEGVMDEWDAEARQTFLDTAAKYMSSGSRFTLIPGRPETAVEALPLLSN